MKLDEFIDAAARYQRRTLWAFFGPLSAALFLVFAYMPFAHIVAVATAKSFGEPVGEIASIVPAAVIMILLFGIMIPLSRRIERRYGIPCPHCGKSLAASKSIVVASKNCPNCGRRVIEFNGEHHD
jgi:hypothetical protein